jgi:DNA polymerase-1
MSENGEHVGGFVGFIKGLGLLCEKFSPSRIIVVWESGGSARRRAIMGSYKSGRRPAALNRYYENDIPATATNHAMQVNMLVKALSHVPVTQIYVKNCEADDIIGYLVRYNVLDSAVMVVSSDKDLYQLIGENVLQYSPGQKKVIDTSEVLQKFGIHPNNFVTARCFIGDSSDDVVGIKGAGFKNISRWFPFLSDSQFYSCQEVVEHAQILSVKNRGKTIKAISEAGSMAQKNWRLMHLDTQNLAADQIKKINDQLENIGTSDKMSLLRMMSQHGMQSFDINRHFVAINSVRYR